MVDTSSPIRQVHWIKNLFFISRSSDLLEAKSLNDCFARHYTPHSFTNMGMSEEVIKGMLWADWSSFRRFAGIWRWYINCQINVLYFLGMARYGVGSPQTEGKGWGKSTGDETLRIPQVWSILLSRSYNNLCSGWMLSRKMEGKHVWKIIHLRMPLGPQVGSLLFSRNKMAYSQVEGESMMERSITVILYKTNRF